MLGHVDGLDETQVFGWAVQSDGKTPDHVQVYVSGVLVAVLPCHLPRSDLKAKGIGDGNGGFRLIFPDRVGADKPTEVVIRSLSRGEIIGQRVIGGDSRPIFLDGDGPFKPSLARRPYAASITSIARRPKSIDIQVRALAPPDAELGVTLASSGSRLKEVRTTVLDFPDIPRGGSIFRRLEFSVNGNFDSEQRLAIFALVDRADWRNRQDDKWDAKLPNPATRVGAALDFKWATFPEISNMERTSGPQQTRNSWVMTGVDTALRLHDVLAAVLPESPGGLRLLDWGVGCGRVAVPLKRLFYPEAELVGVDVDRVNVEWSQANLQDIPVQLGTFAPPTAFDSETFDAIYGISVMTHLTSDMQLAWLRELRRLLKPGGVCVLSTHGEHSLVLQKNRSPEILRELKATGISDFLHDKNLGPKLEMAGYYRATFQLREQVEAIWSREMEVVAYLPTGNGAFQDLVVMRKS